MQWWNKKPSLNFLNNKTLNLPQTKRSDWISKETQLNSLAPKHKNLHQISKPRHTQMRKLTDFKAQVRKFAAWWTYRLFFPCEARIRFTARNRTIKEISFNYGTTTPPNHFFFIFKRQNRSNLFKFRTLSFFFFFFETNYDTTIPISNLVVSGGKSVICALSSREAGLAFWREN